MKKSLLAANLAALILAACGGGSSSDTASTSPTGTTDTYVASCVGYINNTSNQATVSITTTPSSNAATISLHYLLYTGSTNCATATLDTDVTVTGQMTDKGATKNYLNEFGTPVTAKVVTLTYNGLTLVKGNLNVSLPAAGTTTDIAYAITGNKLYFSKGHRGVDGLGEALSPPAVKQ